MKKMLLAVLSTLFLNHIASGQGYLSFNNIYVSPGPAPVTISSAPGTFNPADGPAGAYLGSDYTASLYFLNGIITDQAVFDSSNPMLFAPANVAFLGTTGSGAGHGLSGDYSGFFYLQQVYLSAATNLYGPVTVQVRAWYNGDGAYTSYDQALAAGQNVGESNPVSIFLATPDADPTALEGLLPFTVGVPEPSTPALFALGGLSFWLFRRRK